MHRVRVLGGAFLLLATACAEPRATDAFTAEDWAALRALSPDTLPPPPPDPTNEYADRDDAARLGRTLFFETRFSGRLLDSDNDGGPHTLGERGEAGRVSCAGCHDPTHDFSDTRSLGGAISLGAGWGRRRAPSLLDVGQSRLLMWDGRRDTAFGQVFGPFESPLEMNTSRLFVAQQVYRLHREEYEAVFGPMPALDDPRFGAITPETTGCTPSGPDIAAPCVGASHGIPGDSAEHDALSAEDQRAVTQVVVDVGKAIGAYERRLACGPSAFDAWMHGDPSALSESAQRGAQIFVGRGGCATCHSGPYLSDESFHNVGLRPTTVAVAFIDGNDEGAAEGIAAAADDPLGSRGVFSAGDDDRLAPFDPSRLRGAFRTPRLRCVARRPGFMHTGQMRHLSDVVAFFDRGGDLTGYPGRSEIRPLDLDAQDREDLVAFLESLDGPGPSEEWRTP